MQTKNHPQLLYPSMVIAAIAVTVFSLLGIATLTGALPFAYSETRDNRSIGTHADEFDVAPLDASQKTAAITCPACGTVESVRAIEIKGNGRVAATLVGAADGAYAGNEIEKNTTKETSYRIRVRMSDDNVRTLYQREVPGVSVGDRVKIIEGSVIQRT